MGSVKSIPPHSATPIPDSSAARMLSLERYVIYFGKSECCWSPVLTLKLWYFKLCIKGCLKLLSTTCRVLVSDMSGNTVRHNLKHFDNLTVKTWQESRDEYLVCNSFTCRWLCQSGLCSLSLPVPSLREQWRIRTLSSYLPPKTTGKTCWKPPRGKSLWTWTKLLFNDLLGTEMRTLYTKRYQGLN